MEGMKVQARKKEVSFKEGIRGGNKTSGGGGKKSGVGVQRKRGGGNKGKE